MRRATATLYPLGFHGRKPMFVQRNVSFGGILGKLGFTVEDMLVVSRENPSEEQGRRDGHRVHGSLPEDFWKNLSCTLE